MGVRCGSILLKNSFFGGEEKFLASVPNFNNFYTGDILRIQTLDTDRLIAAYAEIESDR
jgi:hypothetical protein